METKTCAFLGDEVSAAGFRLAGAEVHSPAAGEAGTLFRRLRDECELLILTAETAAEIPGELLQQAADQGRPLVLVVADAARRQEPPDLAARVREQLGMSE
jgi:vacuolar-type H+-ATPase subunit F/Vma7